VTVPHALKVFRLKYNVTRTTRMALLQRLILARPPTLIHTCFAGLWLTGRDSADLLCAAPSGTARTTTTARAVGGRQQGNTNSNYSGNSNPSGGRQLIPKRPATHLRVATPLRSIPHVSTSFKAKKPSGHFSRQLAELVDSMDCCRGSIRRGRRTTLKTTSSPRLATHAASSPTPRRGGPLKSGPHAGGKGGAGQAF
jgi:hypothetical protein